MRFKTWPVAALGLGSLLLLIVVSMLASSRKAQDIYTQLDQLNTHHHNVDAKLRRLRSDVNLSGIFVRDYLLDVARERAPDTASAWPSSARPTWRRSPSSGPLAERHDGCRFSVSQAQARRLLADVRSAVRLDGHRKDLSQRQLSAARGGAAARSGPGDRAGDRGAEQREPGRATRRSHAAPGGVPRRPAPAALAEPPARPRRSR